MIIRLVALLILNIGVSQLHSQNISEAIKASALLYQERNYDEAATILENAIYEHRGDLKTELVEAKLWLARVYMHGGKSKLAFQLYKEIYALALGTGNDSLIVQSGTSYIVALGYEEKSDSIRILINDLLPNEALDYNGRSNLYIELAGYYEDKEMIDSAIHYAGMAAAIDSTHRDSSSIPYTYYDLGNYYISKFDYISGISKILYGLEFIRGEKDEFKKNTIEVGLSNIYYNIGNIYKAEELANDVLDRIDSKGQTVNRTNAYNVLGNCAAYFDEHDAALRYYLKSDSINEVGFKNVWRAVRAGISIIEQKMKLGYAVSEQEIRAVLEKGEGNETAILSNKLSFFKLKVSDFSPAVFRQEYARLYEQSGASQNLKLEQALLQIKRDHLVKNGLHSEAVEVYESLEDIKKRITLANNKYIIQDLEAKHRKKEQALQIQYLDEQNAAQEVILSQQRSRIVGGSIALGLISLLSFFLFRLYKMVNSQKALITKALSEKDLLLREIHHRVKNNLQLVSSLLTLQGRSIDDETAIQAINEGKSRVRSMALIHQDLYNRENLTGIGVKEYVEKLSSELFATYRLDSGRTTLHMDIQDIELDVDTLVPLGLIINELITNSLKYAWDAQQKGLLTVSLTESDGQLHLVVQDDGKGYDASSMRPDSFGATLIAALTEQLGGSIDVKSDQGTKVSISINDYEKR